MVEPTGHCPYLGLKQNQAIRFASPTPEHRCYAAGQAQEIPLTPADYQSAFCLSPNHINCPLYTGSRLPSTSTVAVAPRLEPSMVSGGGLGGWLAGLPTRDRLIYMGLVGLLGVILAIYALAGFGMLRDGSLFGSGGTPPIGEPSAAPPGSSTPPSVSATAVLVASATTTPRATMTAAPSPTASATPSPTATEILPSIEAITNTPTPIPPPPPPPLPIFTPTPTNLPTDLVPLPTEAPPAPTEAQPVPTDAPPVPTEVPPPVDATVEAPPARRDGDAVTP
jgi:hypothetical protein